MPRFSVATVALVCVVGLSSCTLRAQGTGTVTGRVVDSATNTPARSASVTIVALGRTIAVAANGRFIIPNVPVGPHTLRVRAFGYDTVTRQITVTPGNATVVDIMLRANPLMLGAMRIDAAAAEREAFAAQPNVGRVTLTARAMEAIPRVGEADLVRVVSMTPGIQSRNDFSTGFNVRGGESDQNLILIDDYPIYNPFHLGGLFSTFIGSTVRDVQLFNGAFPARYGGRLSSVLDVRSAEEPRAGIHGSAEVSVLATTAAFGGAFGDGRGSWTLAGRRTYADQVARAVSDARLPYHFRDEQAHVSYLLPGSSRLSLTLYDGRDVLDGSFAEISDRSAQSAAGGELKFVWGNLVAGATLSKTLSGSAKLFGRTLGDSSTIEQRISTSRFSANYDAGSGSRTFQNRLADIRTSGAITMYGRRSDRTIGYEVVSYDIEHSKGSPAVTLDVNRIHQRPTTAALYFDDLWRATPSLLLSGGARLETVSGSRWSAITPRVSAKYLTSSTSAITAAAGRFTQWMHSLSYEDDPIRLFDYWRSSDATTPVSTAWQFVIGHERWIGASRYARIETFYKRYDRLLESNFREDPRVNGDEFIDATGVSYGADLLLKAYESGPFSGWLSYTYARSMRQQDSVRYVPAQDRRHDLNVIGTWRVAKFTAGARLGFASGMPYTPAVASQPRRYFDPVLSFWGTGGSRATFDDVGGVRNGSRLPATRRLDLHLERRFVVGRVTMSPYVSVVNATNAHNVLLYIYDFSTAPGTRLTVSQFPVIPSGGMSIVF